ncbi:MAG: hypothetical protein S4CHLAM123_13260 [Chlamydiales bacterium]|nr:hypothetical protein [Chlamydiales bacterium]
MRWGIIAALVLGCGVGLAEEPAADAPKEADPVQEKIEAATQRYYEAIEKIEKDLCRQIDAMVESYADRGELEIVIELQNQKKQFLESGYPPAAPVFASNRRRAQIEITKAINRMDRAYSDVVAQLTRNRDFTSATRIRDEWKEILATINPNIGDGFEAIRQAKLQKAGLAERTPEKAPVPEPTEAASTDQTVPDILKGISGPLSKSKSLPQKNFVRNLQYLTDGIAKGLSPSSGLLDFFSLRTIHQRHAEIILDDPKSKGFLFHKPTEITDGFITALEDCNQPQHPNTCHHVIISQTYLSPNQFERLRSCKNVNLAYPLHLYDAEHVKITKKHFPLRFKDLSFALNEYYPKTIEVALELGPWQYVWVNSPKLPMVMKDGWPSGLFKNDEEFVLRAKVIPKIDQLECFLVFKKFKRISYDILPVLEKRHSAGLRTAFVDCTMPPGDLREKLKQLGIYFISETPDQDFFVQLKPAMEEWKEPALQKWQEDRKKPVE